MVRLKGRDDLNDVTGRLSAGFRSAGLASLHVSFIATAADENKKSAAHVLKHFYQVANKLRLGESAFNRRSRPLRSAGSLMDNLRSREHLAALREFTAAKEGLLEINDKIGQSIIQLIEKDIDISARTRTSASMSVPV